MCLCDGDRGGRAVRDGLLGSDVVHAHGGTHDAADQHNGPVVDILSLRDVLLLGRRVKTSKSDGAVQEEAASKAGDSTRHTINGVQDQGCVVCFRERIQTTQP